MRKVYVDEFQPDNDITKISFYSASSGYVGFKNWIGFTTDTGRTFQRRYIGMANVDFSGYRVNLTFGFGIAGVQAVNADTIIVYGDYGLEPSILFSTDSGNTFKLVYHVDYNPNLYTNGITDMVFPGHNNTGYAVAADRILKTTNKGKTWVPILANVGYFNYVEAASNNDVCAFNGKTLLKTNDGGTTWAVSPLPQNGTINYVFFRSSTQGWINISENKGLYYTSDGGKTWTQKNKTGVTDFWCHKMKFVNDSTGYALGPSYTTYKTVDSGKTWEPLPRDNNYTYLNYSHNDIYFHSADQFWVGGGQGFLELSANAGGAPLPKAYFAIDTIGVYNTSIVKLANCSRQGYQYQWFKNNMLVSTSYNATYVHDIYNDADTIKLVVTNGGKTDTLIGYQYFIPAERPKLPVIDSFDPTIASKYTVINIKGKNLTGTTAVMFGGVAATGVTVVADTLVKAVVGTGATGTVSLSTPAGTATKNGFTFITLLTINSFAPMSGPVGSTITITGTNFSTTPANNIVYVGGIRATVSSATNTELKVVAPSGTSYKPMSVTVGGLTAYSNLPFVTTFAGGGDITTTYWPTRKIFTIPGGTQLLDKNDLNNDGKPELMTAIIEGPNDLTILKNTSTVDSFLFEAQPGIHITDGGVVNSQFATCDVDGDGTIDIVETSRWLNNMYVLKNTSNNNNITMSAPIDAVKDIYKTTINAIAIADFDGDGKPDLCGPTGDAGSGIRVFQNVTNGNNIAFNILPATLIRDRNYDPTIMGDCNVSDLDGDGRPELIVSTSREVLIFKNLSYPGTIAFSTAIKVPSPSSLDFLYTRNCTNIADIDMDGKPDIVLRTGYYSQISILRNTTIGGAISFSAPVNYAASNGIESIAISDANGDGYPDILATVDSDVETHKKLTKLNVWQNKSTAGTIALADQVEFGYDSLPAMPFLAIADYNKDGRPDVGIAENDRFSILLTTGNVPVDLCEDGPVTITSDIKGTSYQWQLKTNGVFNDIVDGGNFSGAKTVALKIKNVPFAWNGYEFRCKLNNTSTFTKNFALVIKKKVIPSITIISSDSVVCAGSQVDFEAHILNEGFDPYFSFNWLVNGKPIEITNPVMSLWDLKNNDSVSAIFTSSEACVTTPSAASNVIVMKVNPTTNPEISISTSDSIICEGSPATFTAHTINGGDHPQYHWQINGVDSIPASPDSVFSRSTLKNDDRVSVWVISSLTCANENAFSNTITIETNPKGLVPVTIEATDTIACAGTVVTFSVAPDNNHPPTSYQWTKNGLPVGDNKNSYIDSILANGDKVSVIVSLMGTCGTNVKVTSNEIVMQVPSSATPGVSITTSERTICKGQSVTFTATLSNGDASSSYQWMKNGVLVGTNNSTYVDSTLQEGDSVNVVIKTKGNCAPPASISSNVIVMHVRPVPTLSVSINASSTAICIGELVTFTANPVGADSVNLYQWTKNGIPVGSNRSTYKDSTLANGDVVKLTASLQVACSGVISATSNSITITVSNDALPSVTISTATPQLCSGTAAQFTAQVVNGGTAPSFEWFVNGTGTGQHLSIFNATNIRNGDKIQVTLITNSRCSSQDTISSNVISMKVGTDEKLVLPDTMIKICAGLEIVIGERARTGYSYSWNSTPAGFVSSLSNPSVSPAKTTLYALSRTNLGTGCIATAGVKIIVDSCKQDATVSLYPNPANTEVTIQISSNDNENKNFQLINSNGQTVLLKEFTANTVKIDISKLPPGLYYYRVTSGFGNTLKTGRLMIQH